MPVGEDQRQHVELAADLAQRFNPRFGETFVVPEAFIQPRRARRSTTCSTPPRRCPSRRNRPHGLINILDDPKAGAKQIKSAVTDDGTEIRFDREAKPGISNLLTIYSTLTGKTIAQLEQEYQGKMYGHLKVDLAEVVVEHAGADPGPGPGTAGRSGRTGPAAGPRRRESPFNRIGYTR